jgi:hypothetical protein
MSRLMTTKSNGSRVVITAASLVLDAIRTRQPLWARTEVITAVLAGWLSTNSTRVPIPRLVILSMERRLPRVGVTSLI